MGEEIRDNEIREFRGMKREIREHARPRKREVKKSRKKTLLAVWNGIPAWGLWETRRNTEDICRRILF